MERSSIASAYAQDMFDSFEYTPEELAEYYDEYADVFDTLSFEYYLVSAERVETTETVTDEETGEETEETTEAVTEETMAEAKENAERILQAYESGAEQSAPQLRRGHHRGDGRGGRRAQRLHPHPGLLCQPVPERRSRRLGARQRAPARRRDHHRERGQRAIYAVVFYGRSDNDVDTVSFRHILIKAVDEDGDGEYSEEELAAAEGEIEDIYAEWQEGEATEDSFYELQQQYSDDVNSSGILYGDAEGAYTHIVEGSMVGPVDEWIFDSARQAGDTRGRPRGERQLQRLSPAVLHRR